MNYAKPIAWLVVVLTLFFGGCALQMLVLLWQGGWPLLVTSILWWALAAAISMPSTRKAEE